MKQKAEGPSGEWREDEYRVIRWGVCSRWAWGSRALRERQKLRAAPRGVTSPTGRLQKNKTKKCIHHGNLGPSRLKCFDQRRNNEQVKIHESAGAFGVLSSSPYFGGKGRGGESTFSACFPWPLYSRFNCPHATYIRPHPRLPGFGRSYDVLIVNRLFLRALYRLHLNVLVIYYAAMTVVLSVCKSSLEHIFFRPFGA